MSSRKTEKRLHMDRRELLQGLAAMATAPYLIGAVPSPVVRSGVRFVDIFLPGGANLLDFFPFSAWPSLAGSTVVAPYFKGLGAVPVPGKSFVVSTEFADAVPVLQNNNSSLCVGLVSGTPAHEFARPYGQTGHHEFFQIANPTATFTTVLGYVSGLPMPSHLILNSSLRTGKFGAAPFLRGSSSSSFNLRLGADPTAASFRGMVEAFGLANKLDDGFFARLSRTQREELRDWYENAVSVRADLAADKFATLLPTTAEVDRYTAVVNAQTEGGLASLYPLAIRAMKHDLTRFIAISGPGFWDTHSDHVTTVPGDVRKVGKVLNLFFEDLAATQDPTVPGSTLADTTVVRLWTEFTRTAGIDTNNGTGHGTWAWALVVGPSRYVRDNQIIGGFDRDYRVLGWDGNGTVPYSATSEVNHGHLICAMYKFMGVDLGGLPALPTSLRQQFANDNDRLGVFV